MLFGTTVLVYLVKLMIWETNFFLATAFLLVFGFIDLVYTTGELNSPAVHLQAKPSTQACVIAHAR